MSKQANSLMPPSERLPKAHAAQYSGGERTTDLLTPIVVVSAPPVQVSGPSATVTVQPSNRLPSKSRKVSGKSAAKTTVTPIKGLPKTPRKKSVSTEEAASGDMLSHPQVRPSRGKTSNSKAVEASAVMLPMVKLPPRLGKKANSREKAATLELSSRAVMRPSRETNSPVGDATIALTSSQSVHPSGETISADQSPVVTRTAAVGRRGGQSAIDTQTKNAAPEFPYEITDHYKVYRQLQNAITRLTLQIKAIERMIAGDNKKKFEPASPQLAAMLTAAATSPLKNARALLQVPYKAEAKAMDGYVVKLPVWQWAKGVRGIGSNVLAQILAETGDLSQYANPAKVWKRMGLGLVRGHRQQFWAATRAGFTKSENIQMAEEMGYVARRRALMAVTGDCLIRAKNVQYGTIYRDYKARKLKELPAKEKGRKMHAHKMALRYMEKRFLLDLWKAWRAAI